MLRWNNSVDRLSLHSSFRCQLLHVFFSKEFYETFWNELKEIFVDSVLEAKEKGILSTSQRQAIIKLTERKDKDTRFIQNRRPISLLNVDLKIISKALSVKLKKVLPNLISSQQTAYVKNRHIGESGRLKCLMS